MSYVYKVNQRSFFDIPGLLDGGEYRNYQATPKVWHWKRVAKNDPDVPVNKQPADSEN
jgi:hypothetical protein